MIIKGAKETHPHHFSIDVKNASIATAGYPTVSLGYKLQLPNSKARDGVYLEWKWQENELHLTNDRYGIYPAYYSSTGSNIGVSTDIFELIDAGASMKLDDAALAVFIRTGYFIGNDTPFESVRALPPNATILWREGKPSVNSSQLPLPSRTSSLKRDEAVRQYGEIFQKTMNGFEVDDEAHVAVPLSGGRDSRHILFALEKAGTKVDCCLTIDNSIVRRSPDAVSAAVVAEALHRRHIVITRSISDLKSELQKNRLTGFCADEHGWFLPMARHLERANVDVIFDGIGGDVLSAGLFLTSNRLAMYSAGKWRKLAEDILGEDDYLKILLQPAYYRRWSRELAIEHLCIELKKYENCPNPFSQFIFWNRTRREVALAPWKLLNGNSHVFAPFLSSSVFDFLASLPGHYFLDGTFHTEAIELYYPQHKHLPYKETYAVPGQKKLLGRAREYRHVLFRCLEMGLYFHPFRQSVIRYRSFLLPRLLMSGLEGRFKHSLRTTYEKSVYLVQLMGKLN